MGDAEQLGVAQTRAAWRPKRGIVLMTVRMSFSIRISR
jgi:hypothetical protein